MSVVLALVSLFVLVSVVLALVSLFVLVSVVLALVSLFGPVSVIMALVLVVIGAQPSSLTVAIMPSALSSTLLSHVQKLERSQFLVLGSPG